MIIFLAALLILMLFAAQRMLYARFWEKGVAVFLEFKRELAAPGEETFLLEQIENRKVLPLPSLKVKFQCSRYLQFGSSKSGAVTDQYYRNDFFSIMGHKRITRTHRITCLKRGYYSINGIDLVGADLFFTKEMHAERESSAQLYVRPASVRFEGLREALSRISGDVPVRNHELEDPFTFRGIREYQPYDQWKQINWKATAKTDELKVNVRDHTQIPGIRIFMNLEDRGILRREELQELCISLCREICEILLAQGIRIWVYGNGEDVLTGETTNLEGLTGYGSMAETDKALARIDLEKPVLEFGKCFSAKLTESNPPMTLFLSADRHQEFTEALCRYRKEQGEHFYWLCPVLRSEEEKEEKALEGRMVFIRQEA